MKKAVSIFAVMIMTMGLFSCEADSAGDDNLYEINAGDGDQAEAAQRDA